jgi:hypothetical protein
MEEESTVRVVSTDSRVTVDAIATHISNTKIESSRDNIPFLNLDELGILCSIELAIIIDVYKVIRRHGCSARMCAFDDASIDLYLHHLFGSVTKCDFTRFKKKDK